MAKQETKEQKFKPNAGEEGFLHYYMTRTNATPPSDPGERQNWAPPRELKKTTPENFVTCYKDHFMANDRFGLISTPEQIISLMKNLTLELYKERFEDVIEGWRKTIRGVDLSNRIKREYEAFKRPRLAGSQLMILSPDDIVYVPKKSSAEKQKIADETLKEIPKNL